jgi:16S rRNA (guanine(966)-N(2))-methyltransferase RsmD
MRVIAGEFRSRRLKSIPGLATRPTPDRLRETLFDILGSRVEAAVFLDAYAGTGAVGIEAISRGAARGVFIERSKGAEKVLRENLASLGIEDRAVVALGAAVSLIPRYQAGIVFLDPPYDRESEYGAALQLLGENPPGLVIAQHSVRFELDDSYGALRRTRVVKHGDNALSFYSAA